MNEDQLYAMRHSLAHITAQAVQHIWPEAKFGVGPVVENGFYYDIDLGETKISEADFKPVSYTHLDVYKRQIICQVSFTATSVIH